MPFHRLRGSQVRVLFERYVEVEVKDGNLEAIKEVVRLLMSLPEYQMQ